MMLVVPEESLVLNVVRPKRLYASSPGLKGGLIDVGALVAVEPLTVSLGRIDRPLAATCSRVLWYLRMNSWKRNASAKPSRKMNI